MNSQLAKQQKNSPAGTADRRLNVLVVDEEIPFPLNTGKRIRSYNLLKNLAHRHNLTFLCHQNFDQQERELGRIRFEQLGIQVVFLNRELPRPTVLTSRSRLFWDLMRNVFSARPYVVQKHMSSELRHKLIDICADDQIDLVHFEWTPYAAALPDRFDKPWIANAHNVESLIWKRYFEIEANRLKRQYVKNQWKKFDRFERNVFQSANHIVFVSKPDQQLGESEFRCRQSAVVDNGVDVNEFRFEGPAKRDHNRILFLGSLDWRPNIDGICWFLDSVWPLVQKQCPDMTLDIVGRTPPSWFVERIRKTANANLFADVPSVIPCLTVAGLMVVPLRIGGGSRLKILEAAAAGLPVISTSLGAEGLDFDAGVHFISANTANRFADAICATAGDLALQNDIAVAARKRVEEKYDWPVLAEKLDFVWRTQADHSE